MSKKPMATNINISVELTKDGWQWQASTREESLGNGVAHMPGDAVREVSRALLRWTINQEKRA